MHSQSHSIILVLIRVQISSYLCKCSRRSTVIKTHSQNACENNHSNFIFFGLSKISEKQVRKHVCYYSRTVSQIPVKFSGYTTGLWKSVFEQIIRGSNGFTGNTHTFVKLRPHRITSFFDFYVFFCFRFFWTLKQTRISVFEAISNLHLGFFVPKSPTPLLYQIWFKSISYLQITQWLFCVTTSKRTKSPYFGLSRTNALKCSSSHCRHEDYFKLLAEPSNWIHLVFHFIVLVQSLQLSTFVWLITILEKVSTIFLINRGSLFAWKSRNEKVFSFRFWHQKTKMQENMNMK